MPCRERIVQLRDEGVIPLPEWESAIAPFLRLSPGSESREAMESNLHAAATLKAGEGMGDFMRFTSDASSADVQSLQGSDGDTTSPTRRFS